MRPHQHLNRLDNLEPRLLLASFATLNSAGVLSVVGTSSSNAINVAYSDDKIKATRDGSSLYFAKSKVKAVWAEGFGGNDKITIGVTLPSTLIGDAGNDTLVGNIKNDQLHGGSGDDHLTGGGSEDRTWPEFGDSYDPGGGKDVIDFSAQKAGRFGLKRLGDEGGLLNYSVNHNLVSSDFVDGHQPVTILLTAGNDDFEAEGYWNSVIVDGGAGNDHLRLDPVDGGVKSFVGGSGNDTFFFTDYDSIESVYAGPGNDSISDLDGVNGPKICDGGSGYDTYSLFPAGSDYREYDVYDCTIPPGIEAFYCDNPVARELVIHGNSLNNNITGLAGGVTIYGNGGNDRLNVEPAPDDGWWIGQGKTGGPSLLDGGSGNDTLVGTNASGVFKGGSGSDTADFSARTDNLKISLDNKPNDGAAGGSANVMADVETVLGGSGADKLTGNPFNNLLKGNAGNDTLWGGSGNDTLDGGGGHDMLFGQDGNDTLLAKDGRTDSLDGGSGYDKARRDNSATIKDQILNVEAFV